MFISAVVSASILAAKDRSIINGFRPDGSQICQRHTFHIDGSGRITWGSSPSALNGSASPANFESESPSMQMARAESTASRRSRRHSPDAVEDPSVREDAHVDVGHDDVVEMSLSLVGEEQIRHPDFARIGQRQIFEFTCAKKRRKMKCGCCRSERDAGESGGEKD